MHRVSPYLRMRVLGAIEFAPGKTIKDRIVPVSSMVFHDEDDHPRQFTWRTIQTWYSRYQKDGITTMKPRPRTDKGKTRKVSPEHVLEAIESVRPRFRGGVPNVTAIYRACIESGALLRDQIAHTTFRRIVKQHEMLKPDRELVAKRRLAFAKAHANELWQADTMYAYVKTDNGRAQSKLIAFIGDASRVVTHGEFFVAENTDTLIQALRSAFYKRGLPDAMYVDHGGIYSSKEINQICQRVGCLLCHAPVRDGAAKGKIERFFRHVRQAFLIRQLDLSSLAALNRAFFAWVEDEYNAREHSVLGMKPIDRFGLDLARIRFLPPGESNDELFFVEQDRNVLADNTFSLKRVRYEAPRDLRNRKIQVRFPRPSAERVVVFYKGDRMGEARPVDFLANDRRPPGVAS